MDIPSLLIHPTADVGFPIWGHPEKVSISISAYVFEYPHRSARGKRFPQLQTSGRPDFSLLDCTVTVTQALGSLILSSRIKNALEIGTNAQMEAYKVFGESDFYSVIERGVGVDFECESVC